jgi:NAD(P)-dependent dehydrogenase (short-subunit alcohol dehydrogenase family)
MGALDGQVAAITGAGTGIGVGIARRLAAEGAAVVICAYNSFAGCEKLADEITTSGGAAIPLKLDFRQAANARAIVDTAISEHGRLDILVNNAGFTMTKPFLECTEQDWDDIFNINLKSMFVTCLAAIPHMQEREYGRIINISSVHSRIHYENHVLYGSTKGGINEFTRALVTELAGSGITANVIAPGAIYVERYDRAGLDQDRMIRSIPSRRVGTVEDIAGAAYFLASPDSAYVNGEVIFVDGGLTTVGPDLH